VYNVTAVEAGDGKSASKVIKLTGKKVKEEETATATA
jgi:hypothetical protein